jgi:hypothetical protein
MPLVILLYSNKGFIKNHGKITDTIETAFHDFCESEIFTKTSSNGVPSI